MVKTMRFVKCDFNEVEKKRKSNLSKLILEFRDSGIKCAKLEDWKYCSPRCGAGTINRSAKNLKLHHIKAVVIDDNIYLINTITKE